MNLTELSKVIRKDNAERGFDPTEGGIDRYLLLAISEICEAQNELRDGRKVDEIYYEMENTLGLKISPANSKDHKPCGFPVEIADAIIRLLDICGKFDIEVKILQGYYDLRTGTVDTILLETVSIISRCKNGVWLGMQREDFEPNIILGINRLFAIANTHKIDIMKVIQEKLEFNRSRPPKHGRKF